MNCSHLSARLEVLFPQESPREIARVSLLMLNRRPELDESWTDAQILEFRQQALTSVDACADQHDAMTLELEELCGGDTPVRFHPDRIWTLLRAIKVQSQMLDLYLPASIGHIDIDL